MSVENIIIAKDGQVQVCQQWHQFKCALKHSGLTEMNDKKTALP